MEEYVVQPDGKLAVFSHKVSSFIKHGMDLQIVGSDASEDISRGVGWDLALELLVLNHGLEDARQTLDGMGLASYAIPYDLVELHDKEMSVSQTVASAPPKPATKADDIDPWAMIP